MRSRWVNLILHATALVQKTKDKLLVTHSIKSVFIILALVVLETFLALISLPLYLVQKVAPVGSKAEQYRSRRLITLSLLTFIGVVWIIKLTLAVGTQILWQQRSVQIQNLAEANKITTEEEVFATERAVVNYKLLQAVVTKVVLSRTGGVTFSGQAGKNAVALVYVTPETKAVSGQPNQVTVLSARADKLGNWSINSLAEQYHFPKGKYMVWALDFDDKNLQKSGPGKMVSFTISSDPLTTQTISLRVDQVLNWAIIIFVIIGVITTALLT